MYIGLAAFVYASLLLAAESLMPYTTGLAIPPLESLLLIALVLVSTAVFTRLVGPITALAMVASSFIYTQGSRLLLLALVTLIIYTIWKERGSITNDVLLVCVSRAVGSAKDRFREFMGNLTPLELAKGVGYILISGGLWIYTYTNLRFISSITLYIAGYILNAIIAILLSPKGSAKLLGYFLTGGSIPYTVPLMLLTTSSSGFNTDNPGKNKQK